jgi:hypothetical protein
VKRTLLFLLGLVGCEPTIANKPPAPPPPPAPAKVAAEVRSFNHPKPAVHVEWLVLTLPSATAAAKISSDMEKNAVSAGRALIADAAKETANRDVSPDEWSLHRSCRTTALRATLVSIRCEEDVYMGGAHGMSYTRSLNYAIVGDDAQRLTLDDVLAPPWMPSVDTAIMDSLRRQEAMWVTDGSLKTVAEMLHTWNITTAGVVFAFDPYEVGPYAQGPMEVLLGWPALAKVRRIPGPLDAVVAAHPDGP